MEGRYRPSRLDHFPKKADLVRWLEDHALPVATKGSAFEHEDNINTMLKATGALGASWEMRELRG